MRILIHMGNYKTGSTALQHFFYRNAEILKQNRICYSGYDEEPLYSHASLTYRILIETLDELGMTAAYNQHPLTAFLQKPSELLWQEICRQAEKNGANTILISHEAIFCEAYRTFCGLSSVPSKEEQERVLQLFHKRLSELVDKEKNEVFAIVYLRKRESYLDSQYNQYIKEPWYEENVILPTYEEFVEKKPVTLDYDRPLSMIRDLYGTDHVLTARYEDVDNLYQDFWQKIPDVPDNLWRAMQLPDAGEVNQSLSFDAVSFKKNVLPPAFARNAQIQKILEEYSVQYPDKESYTWGNDDTKKRYPGLTEEACMKIMQYVTDRAGA
jgi:hypothetical protein